MFVVVLGTVVGGAVAGMAPAPADAPLADRPQADVVADGAPGPTAEGAYQIPPPRWLKPRTPAVPAEREHGTDGLVGWFPFRALYEASAADTARDDRPASTRDGHIRRNGGLGWVTDAYAE